MNRSIFFAFIYEPGQALPARLAAARQALLSEFELAVLFEDPGCSIVGQAAAAHARYANGGGIVWGHLFNRATGAPVREIEAVEDPRGTLLTKYWGGYVSMRRAGDSVEVVRDPSGTMACYHTEVEGAHVVTSRPDLFFVLGLVRPDIDWSVLAQGLVYRDVRPARTALRSISEILPAIMLCVGGGRTELRPVWSPWTYVSEAPNNRDFVAATALVRGVVTDTLRSWRSAFDKPLIEISGGLDSAIVAAGMATGSGDASCLTFGPVQGDPDERPWARTVADHVGLGLIELALDLSAVDVSRSDAAHLPRPCVRLFSQALDRPIQALAADTGADSFFGGAGGDSIFCLLQSALPVIDRLRAEGPSAGVARTAIDIAQLSNSHAWRVMGVAFQRWLRPLGRLPTPMTNGFVTREARDGLPWPQGHPWLEAPAGVASGSRRHVWSIVGILNHLEGYGREAKAPYISPLMSQPILEACLSVPTWLWCEGGRNRAVAREAFRDSLPAMVIDRSTKGAFNGLVTQLLDQHRALIKEMLLDGLLARNGILDREATMAGLSGELPTRDALSQLMALVDFESWASGWSSY